MSYPPYGGGGYPPGSGYPPANPNPNAYPPQAGGYPPAAPGGACAPAAPGSAFGGQPPAAGYPAPPSPYSQSGYPGQGQGAYGSQQYGQGQPSYGYGQPGYGQQPAPQPGYAAQGYVPQPQPGYGPGQPQPGYGQGPHPGYPAAGHTPHAGSPPSQQQTAPEPPTPEGKKEASPPERQSITDDMAQDFERMKMYGTLEIFRGTVVAEENFDAEEDCKILRKAMYGRGTDEKAILDLIATRSNQQRQDIKIKFKTMYGKDLIKDLESELSGDFRETIMACFTETTYYDAWSLHNAMTGVGTKEDVLIEILCTRTNQQIREIVQCYRQHFRRDLEKDIKDDTSGHFKRLLISASQGNRDELTDDEWKKLLKEGPESVVNREKAKKEAEELYKAGEKKWGTDESAFNRIMNLRHYYQLRATFEEYVKITQRDIINTIDREFSGDIKDGMKALIMSARNRPQYFADRLKKSMHGAGTDDSTLIRVVVSRAEVDMVQIKKCFLDSYHKTLWMQIEGDTSGDYKRVLQAIVGKD